MILVDILIFGAIILFAINGFRRGALRGLFTFFRVYLSFIIATLFYGRAAIVLSESFDKPSPLIPAICFTIIFLALTAAIWGIGIALKDILKPPRTSGTLNKVGGTVIGVLEGTLLVSVVIMVLSLYFPADIQSALESATYYKTVKQVAPAIKEFTVGHISSLEKASREAEPAES